MRYFMPVKVYEQEECVRAHAKEIASFGEKALIVTGRYAAAANGSLSDVTAALSEQGRAYCVFSEVEENPSVQTVFAGKQCGMDAGADFVIGIGGGSPLDAAKAIALLMAHPEWDEEMLYGSGAEENALPVIAVPTTCGTGSEVTGVSVLTRHAIGNKKSIPAKIFPKLALLDAKYLAYLPDQTLKNTAVDALAHGIESYLHVNASDYSRACAVQSLRLWRTAYDQFVQAKDGRSMPYAAFLRASSLGGMAIAQTGTSLPHGLSYYLTYHLGMPHGKAAGYCLPGFLEESQRQNPQDTGQILELLHLSDVNAFRQMIDNLLGTYDLERGILYEAAASLLENPAKMNSVAWTPAAEDLHRICRLDG